jgi:hypothetical protein
LLLTTPSARSWACRPLNATKIEFNMAMAPAVPVTG